MTRRSLSLLSLLIALPLAAQSLPSITLTAAQHVFRLEPGERTTIRFTARNSAPTTATNVKLTVTVKGGGTIDFLHSDTSSAQCVFNSRDAVCTTATLAQSQSLDMSVGYFAPTRTTGEDLAIEATVTSAEADAIPRDNFYEARIDLPRQVEVKNTEDDGPGSLRQAIRDLATFCKINETCGIAFRIPPPVPAGGTYTIALRTPLPEIAASVVIDGRTQTLFSGDSNNDGPEIEISGRLLTEGSGLRLRPECGVDVRNLAVSGFPGYGIEVRREYSLDPAHDDGRDCFGLSFPIVVENNLLTGNQRGVGMFVLTSEVLSNTIRLNKRAGIYVADSYYAVIRSNRVTENGAGMFIDAGGPRIGASGSGNGGADVIDNLIFANDGMAIARTRRGDVMASKNRIFGNLTTGIDIDTDGPTPNTLGDNDVPNAPLLTSATYDPVLNVTVVRGRLDSDVVAGLFVQQYMIEVFASSRLSRWGYAEAEGFMGQKRLDSGHEEFEIALPGDLRGKWITATNTASHFVGYLRTPRNEDHRADYPGDTSELSNAVRVE